MSKKKENSLYLPIKQVYFDAILDGTKYREYRQIRPTTISKYIKNKRVNGELQLEYYPNLISEESLEQYANDIMYYNDGVFPYVPKEIKYLDLVVGYHKNRDTMTVEVTDISFEPLEDDNGNILRYYYNNEQNDYMEDKDGDLTNWVIVFHLGKVVEKDLKKNR